MEDFFCAVGDLFQLIASFIEGLILCLFDHPAETVCGIVLVIFLGCFGWWTWSKTPEYAINEAIEGLRNVDLAKLQGHVNLAGVCAAASKDMFASTSDPKSLTVVKKACGLAVFPSDATALNTSFEYQIKHALESAHGQNAVEVFGVKLGGERSDLVHALHDWDLTFKNYRGLTEGLDLLSPYQSTAIRHATFGEKDKTTTITINLVKKGFNDDWHIDSLGDLKPLIVQLSAGEQPTYAVAAQEKSANGKQQTSTNVAPTANTLLQTADSPETAATAGKLQKIEHAVQTAKVGYSKVKGWLHK